MKDTARVGSDTKILYLRDDVPPTRPPGSTKTQKACLLIGLIGLTILAIGIIVLIARCRAEAGDTSAFVKKVDKALCHCAEKLSGDPKVLAACLMAIGFGLALTGLGI